MSWTKKQFILAAYEEIGLGSYIFDIQPEQLQAALRKLDTMMATWNAVGIRLSYPLPSNPDDSDISQLTTVPDKANEAIILNLALRLAPTIGKAVSMETTKNAKASYNMLLSHFAKPVEMQIPNLPLGAGHKAHDYRFMSDFNPTLDAGDDDTLDFN